MGTKASAGETMLRKESMLQTQRTAASKLVDYTKHRRDDMPSMKNHLEEAALLCKKASDSISADESYVGTLSCRTSLDDVEPIDFLLKVPLVRRRQHSSSLSREQLLVECDKHACPTKKTERIRRPSAESRNSSRSEGRRVSLISVILSRDLLRGEDDDNTVRRRNSARLRPRGDKR